MLTERGVWASNDSAFELGVAREDNWEIVSTLSRLGKQIEEIIAALNSVGVRFALIGGLALASYKVIRATRDIDLLTDVKSADEIDRLLTLLGYRCIHRSADAGNYLRGDERVDFLYASRPAARQLLAAAAEFKTAFGDLRVVSLEGLIGFKLQGFVNDARRTQDLEDIRALILANRSNLKMTEVREYFRLFDREVLLKEILDEIG
jgi:predicted nucleotidyltransferase